MWDARPPNKAFAFLNYITRVVLLCSRMFVDDMNSVESCALDYVRSRCEKNPRNLKLEAAVVELKNDKHTVTMLRVHYGKQVFVLESIVPFTVLSSDSFFLSGRSVDASSLGAMVARGMWRQFKNEGAVFLQCKLMDAVHSKLASVMDRQHTVQELRLEYEIEDDRCDLKFSFTAKNMENTVGLRGKKLKNFESVLVDMKKKTFTHDQGVDDDMETFAVAVAQQLWKCAKPPAKRARSADDVAPKSMMVRLDSQRPQEQETLEWQADEAVEEVVQETQELYDEPRDLDASLCQMADFSVQERLAALEYENGGLIAEIARLRAEMRELRAEMQRK